MNFAPKRTAGSVRNSTAAPVDITPCAPDCRYDAMLLAFHDYIVGKQENPFNYDHEYAVQKVLWDAVGGVQILGTQLEERKMQ